MLCVNIELVGLGGGQILELPNQSRTPIFLRERYNSQPELTESPINSIRENRVIFVHIGTHKTGSTSLQQLCDRAASQLREDGVLYPKAGRPNSHPWAHHILAWSVQQERGFNNLEGWEKVAREIRKSGAARVLISSEGFVRCSVSDIKKIKCLLPNAKVKAIVYLRNPVDYVISLYKEKITGKGEARSFKKFSRNKKRMCNYPALIDSWKKGLKEPVIVRSFEDQSEGGLEKDFLQILDVKPNTYSRYIREPANISISTDRIVTIRWINRLQKYDWTPNDILHRVKRNIIRGTWRGKCLTVTANLIFLGCLYRKRDINWFRKEIGNISKTFLKRRTRKEEIKE